MSTFLMPVYDSDVGPYIIDIRAKDGNEAVKSFIEEIKQVYSIDKDINSLDELDQYIMNEHTKGILILGEIYNIEDYKK